MSVFAKNNHFENGGRKLCVIGIHLQNGIFHEDENNRGISYILDHVIYNSLYDRLNDLHCGHVRSFTNYGYSSFLIQCEEKHYEEVLEIAIENTHASCAVCEPLQQ